jgi:ribosomal protein S18 acetylase RimI-like enzyme
MRGADTLAPRVRLASAADAPALANIHRRALPADLLPRLGERFLSRVFLQLALRPDLAFTLVAVAEGEQRAFVVYATNPPAFSRALATEHPHELLRALARRGVSDPLLALDLLRAVRSTSGSERLAPRPTASLPELYVIATDPAFQSLGLGRQLVRRGLAELSMRGAAGCVVRTASLRARKFYEREGFAVTREEKRRERTLVVLMHKLDAVSPRNP